MINANLGNSILKGLFGQGMLYLKTDTKTSSNYSLIDGGLGKECYLGLLTNRDQSKTLQEDKTYPAFSDTTQTAEIKDKQYGRVCLGNLEVPQLNLLSVPSDCAITNKNKFIQFNELDPNPEVEVKHVITHFGLYSTASGGSPIYIGKLNETITAVKGQVILFRPSDFKMTIGKDGDIETSASALTV